MSRHDRTMVPSNFVKILILKILTLLGVSVFPVFADDSYTAAEYRAIDEVSFLKFSTLFDKFYLKLL